MANLKMGEKIFSFKNELRLLGTIFWIKHKVKKLDFENAPCKNFLAKKISGIPGFSKKKT